MSANSRMSLAVHVLTWIAFDRRGTDKEIATSARIATSVNTNPVVIRRCLGELRDAGLVQATRGRDGGWALTRNAAGITLLDVYLAVGGEEIFAMPAAPPDAECYVGYGIQPVLARVYDAASDALCASLKQTTIADVLRDAMAEYAAGAATS
ncbi:Rrf2 family transcriptional regulator [Mycolicibacterium goodii]|uniref:Rrf2 family transcriptional regulator n=1 Tax=Mycolicibacterium goodii TaxID=134601 RepID=A0ABS6HTV4_MYCGD|nr:Rrf2 family transcriptional regulator [Mycolicibacterium goodii]MBU8824767.1 Rrf2 family transcriptional regulator [Mycolicibacterium goodii]MBU8840266.1 Rrf2 family transcriptional regulator [Mycolicibacterium goodii]